MTSTQSFIILGDSWRRMVEHWEITSFFSFITALFSYSFGIGNGEFVSILSLIIFVDTCLGSLLAIYKKNFTAKGMGKAIGKVVIYGGFLMTIHIAELLIERNTGAYFGMLDMAGYYFLILREAKSVNEKLASLNLPIPFNPFARVEKVFNKIAETIE